MAVKRLDVAILTGCSLAILFLHLGNSRFWDQDEGYYASVAYEMYRRGDWIVPTFNEQLFAHKPPMMYWGMLLGFHVLGVSEFAARLPSAIFGCGSVLLVYALGRRLFDRSTGLLAGLVLTSCFMFTIVARSATADAHLCFFVMLAIYLWCRDAVDSRSEIPIAMQASRPLSIRWPTWIAVYAAMGMAVLCKGPIGVAFPITILALVHLGEVCLRTTGGLQSFLISLFRTVWGMRPLTGAIVISMVAGPWFIAMQWVTDGVFLGEFLGVHHLQRFSQAMDNHSGPIYYYILACLIGLYPWSAFAIPTAWNWLKRETRTSSFRGWLLVSAWIGVYLGVFSVASTKLPNYVIPAYPPLAIVIGVYMSTWGSQSSAMERRWQITGWILLFFVGLLVVFAPLVLTSAEPFSGWLDRLQLDPSTRGTIRWISLLGVPLVVGGIVGLVLRSRDRTASLAPCFAITAGAMTLLFWQVIVPIADRHQTPQDIATALANTHRNPDDPPSIAVLEYFRPSMVYYSGSAIDFFTDLPALAERLQSDPAPVVVLKEKSFESVRSLLPEGYRVTQSHSEFPRRGKVLILAPPLRR